MAELRVRAFRRSDGPHYARWLMDEFPTERDTVRYTTASLQNLIERAYAPGIQFVVRFLRLFRVPIYDLYLAEVAGQAAGTAFLGYGKRAGYIASVVTDPQFRGRGVASAILARAHADLRRFGRRFVVLEVLLENEGARRLYRKLGYTQVRTLQTYLGPERSDEESTRVPSIRALRPSDVGALSAIAEAATPAPVREAQPIGKSTFTQATGWAAFEGKGSAGWVIESGDAPAGFFRTTFGSLSPVGHLSSPLFGSQVTPEERSRAVRFAVATLGRQGARQVVCELPDDHAAARQAIESEGFRPAYGSEMLRLTLGDR
ncbi:MAG TPA: GNAT family N-acetyltransferase [Thermoplasmata archaeon]|nr:GNAT family N-acetyltransferase [Thermoplasmata archaeon]